jgi:hypothetical protein
MDLDIAPVSGILAVQDIWCERETDAQIASCYEDVTIRARQAMPILLTSRR